MTVYFQHVGEAGGRRDFPRTIGTPTNGLVKFHWSDVEPHLSNLSAAEKERLQHQLGEVAPDGFQIWGIPAGAKYVLRTLTQGDILLLLESATVGGQFAYAGRVIGNPPKECPELSVHLWTEHKFPLIVFLLGGLTRYSYRAFCEAFGYKTNWNPAGQTYRLPPERLESSPFGDEDQLISSLIGFVPSLRTDRPYRDTTFADVAELDISDEEGRKLLRLHLKRERSSKLVAAFKRQLQKFICSVCGFDFERMYGALGQGFIEAHHTIPVSQMEEGQKTNIADLVPVCSNCHRMLHRRSPPVDWQELKRLVGENFIEMQEGR